MIKTDFDNKLTSFDKQVTWNITKHLEVQRRRNSVITKDYNFFLGRIYFTCNDGSKTHSFIKTKVQIMFLVGDQMDYITLNLRHYMLLSYITFFVYKMGMKFDKDPLAVDKKITCPKLWTSMD